MNASPAATVISVGTHPAVSACERLGALFDSHERRLYRLARRLASNADDARDLVQETFLRAAKSPTAVPTGFNDEEAWLVRVLVNICHYHWRKAAVRRNADVTGLGQAPSNPRVGVDRQARHLAGARSAATKTTGRAHHA